MSRHDACVQHPACLLGLIRAFARARWTGATRARKAGRSGGARPCWNAQEMSGVSTAGSSGSSRPRRWRHCVGCWTSMIGLGRSKRSRQTLGRAFFLNAFLLNIFSEKYHAWLLSDGPPLPGAFGRESGPVVRQRQLYCARRSQVRVDT